MAHKYLLTMTWVSLLSSPHPSEADLCGFGWTRDGAGTKKEPSKNPADEKKPRNGAQRQKAQVPSRSHKINGANP